MAHNLEFVDGKAQIAYVGETPWHSLGTQVLPDLTPAQMLKEAGLDWRVEKRPMFFTDQHGNQVQTKAEALVRDRDDSVLSIVTESWNPLQNEDAFEFFSEFVQAGDMEMHTAGSLNDGRHVWALAKMKDSFFDIFKGDRTEGYCLFSLPHQFGKSITVQFTPIRVVCDNTITLSLQLGSSNVVRSSHRAEFDPAAVKDTMGLATNKLAKYKEMAEFLGSKRYSDENIVEYFQRVFPLTSVGDTEETKSSRNARKALALVETQPGAQFAPGSWWQAFNSVTYLVDHEIGRNANNRMESAWFGQNKNRKLQALDLAIEMATAA